MHGVSILDFRRCCFPNASCLHSSHGVFHDGGVEISVKDFDFAPADLDGARAIVHILGAIGERGGVAPFHDDCRVPGRAAGELLTALTGERDPLRDDRYLHYLTTTAGGCSGAPVLDWFDLSVIAVHHRGNIEPPAPTSRNRRSRGRNEPQSAAQTFNEGVRVTAIIAAIQRFPSGETEAQPEARVDVRPS